MVGPARKREAVGHLQRKPLPRNPRRFKARSSRRIPLARLHAEPYPVRQSTRS